MTSSPSDLRDVIRSPDPFHSDTPIESSTHPAGLDVDELVFAVLGVRLGRQPFRESLAGPPPRCLSCANAREVNRVE